MGSSSGSGHVFVVHGRIESVVHDVALVPTSTDFHVRGYWKPVVGAEPSRLRPQTWPGDGFGRAEGSDRVWFVSVGGRRGDGADAIVARAIGALREIRTSEIEPASGRTKLVVAVPVMGVAGGGLDSDRGGVLLRLLDGMESAARELDLDVAIVTPDRSLYGAAQHLRRKRAAWPLPDRQLAQAKRLGAQARDGELALFLGAGVSIPAGLPTWSGLLARLAAAADLKLSKEFGGLNVLDQAQYLSVAVPHLGEEVANVVREAAVPSLSHTFLAALGCREAVTTNYDRLYEKAVRMQRGRRNVATILPWQPPRSGKQWILKMHGDVKDPDSIVLTRQQFVRYDAETRPAGALLQTLLLTRHVLFVGASLNDDNVVRLAYEVDQFRRKYDLKGTVGTVLDVDADPVRRELWAKQLRWVSMAGTTIEERSRTLEIFLDAVAAYASDDASWLLDERFDALLGSRGDLVRSARQLHREAARAGAEWQALADALAAFGAAGDDTMVDPDQDPRWRSRLPYN